MKNLPYKGSDRPAGLYDWALGAKGPACPDCDRNFTVSGLTLEPVPTFRTSAPVDGNFERTNLCLGGGGGSFFSASCSDGASGAGGVCCPRADAPKRMTALNPPTLPRATSLQSP